jgi:hypothetical protein
MELWTNGDVHVVATGRGIARLTADRTDIQRFALGKLRRGDEPPDLDAFAVLDLAGERVMVGRNGGLQLCTFAGPPSMTALSSQEIRAAVARDNGELVVCAAREGDDQRTRSILCAAKVVGEALVLGAELAVPKPRRLDWPKLIWAKNAVPWPEDDSDPDLDEPFEPDQLDVRLRSGHWQGHPRLHANRHGLVATSNYSGVVAMYDAETLAPRFAVRVPTQSEADLFAVATSTGAVVVLVIEGRHSAVLHLDPSGSLTASRGKLGREPTWGLGAPLVIGEDPAGVSHVMTSPVAYELALPGLEGRKAKGLEETPILAHASNRAHDRHLIASGDHGAQPHRWSLLEMRADGLGVARERAMPDLRPPEKPAEDVPVGPVRARGAPSLTLSAKPGTTSWACPSNGTALLELTVTSKGGPVSGLYVELGGPAVASGVVTGDWVTLGSESAAFDAPGAGPRAALPAGRMEAGFAVVERVKGRAPPPAPLPDPALELRLTIRGAKPGQGLLTVRVGSLAAGAAGSGMQGKNLVVTA